MPVNPHFSATETFAHEHLREDVSVCPKKKFSLRNRLFSSPQIDVSVLLITIRLNK